MSIFNWIYGIKDAMSMAGSVFVIVACVAFIVLVAYFAIKIPSKVLAVIVSTMGAVVFMIPIVTSFNAIVDKSATSEQAKEFKATLELRKKEIELAEKQKELEKQKLVSLRQKVNIETLENEVTLLKNSQLQIGSYKEIAEVNLLETNFQQTRVDYRQLNNLEEKDRGLLKLYEKYMGCDKILVVLTHDIIAKFGFDINEVRIIDSEDVPDTLLVSQVKPKFTGTTKNKVDKILTEVRHLEIDTDKMKKAGINWEGEHVEQQVPANYKHLSIDYAREAEAGKYADKVINEFNERLAKGLETEFLNKPLEELCKKFIKSMLLPLNKKIVFVEQVKEGALSIDDYFKTKIEKASSKMEQAKTVGAEKVLKEVNEELEQIGREIET